MSTHDRRITTEQLRQARELAMRELEAQQADIEAYERHHADRAAWERHPVLAMVAEAGARLGRAWRRWRDGR